MGPQGSVSSPKVVLWSPWHGLQLLPIRNVVNNPIMVGGPRAGRRHRITHGFCGVQLKQTATSSLAAKELLSHPLEAGRNGTTPSKC